MTDAEIMKALSICSSEHLGCEDGCPYIEVPHCYVNGVLLKDALDLINRQKAEIERLQRSLNETNKYLPKIKEQAKAEAIKEFTKLVNRRLNSNTPRGAYLYNIMKEVEKEMAGGK